MKKLLKIVFLLLFLSGFAQDKITQNVYFDFDVDLLKVSQKDLLCNFFQKIDSSQIQSVRVFGYCDDRGSATYNFNLSDRRVSAVEKIILNLGLNPKKLIALEGRGRVLVNKDTVPNLDQTRSKNRRVEIVVEQLSPSKFFMGIPRLFSEFHLPHQKGDRIYLENVRFGIGSSYLDLKSRTILDKMVLFLKANPYVEFEIQGHVCCTPKYFSDAIDKDTKERKLSYNRAKAVYRYLVMRKINPSRMSFKGYGNQFPMGKATELDRRVELVITKC
jgi:outer membrane protein OmpA-like peptidoglycan-associated protein